MAHAEVAPATRDRILDEEHLRLLSRGHYITGALHIAFASMFVLRFIFLLIAASNPDLFPPQDPRHPGPPDGMLVVFAWIVGFPILAGWTFGALTVYSGRCMKARTRRTLTFVPACLNTLLVPFGTVLGVFTLVVPSRPSVRRLYGP